MDKVIEYIPAILILVSVMTIVIIILTKYGDKIFDKEYKADNVLLLVAGFLFTTVLIVHLFKEQAWTPDTLKFLIGVLVGAGSSKLGRRKDNVHSSAEIHGSNIDGDVAGRDINKNIQNIKDAVSDIKDSVIHQNNQIKQVIGDTVDNDYLINTIFERGNKISAPIERVIQHWQRDGWTLKHFSSDYQGMDGIYLIFSRPKQGDQPQVEYHHGSRVD
jgi:hypothetical protein